MQELAAAAGVHRVTAYRLASVLVNAGLVERDQSRMYYLGVESLQLGLAAMRLAPIVTQLQPVMRRLARRTEDTIFLVVRNGDYGHCLHSEEGSYPVKAMVLRVGGMRVLGIGSAGLTLLSMLSDVEIQHLYARHESEFLGGPNLARLERLVEDTRTRGYADTDSLVAAGVSGVGMSFEVSTGSHAAVSIAAIRSRMPPERKQWIAELMASELSSAGFKPSFPPLK